MRKAARLAGLGFAVSLALILALSGHALAAERVSVDSSGNQGNVDATAPSISGDGRFVAFVSKSSNLVSGDTNLKLDIFVHDRQTHQTSRVSVDSSGNEANGDSSYPCISAGGRYVAFESAASNLVSGDTNGKFDIFVHDRQTHQTTRVSVDSSGNEVNWPSDPSHSPSISADGRFVTFHSSGTKLVPGDTNSAIDVFVHDRQTGQTTRVSVNSSGNQVHKNSYRPSISANGRYVAFDSLASNLAPGHTKWTYGVFVHDRQTHETTRVSVDSSGNQGNGFSFAPSISADGRYVVFHSRAFNLVPRDTNPREDIFVHDLQTHQTMRMSLDPSGNEADGNSSAACISVDGRYVAFESAATNLVPGDTNAMKDVFVTLRLSPISVIPRRPLVPVPITPPKEDRSIKK